VQKVEIYVEEQKLQSLLETLIYYKDICDCVCSSAIPQGDCMKCSFTNGIKTLNNIIKQLPTSE